MEDERRGKYEGEFTGKLSKHLILIDAILGFQTLVLTLIKIKQKNN